MPSLLAAGAAILAAWTSIERPHERWSLYRGYQRLLEGDRVRYRQGVAPFDGADRDDRLAELLAERQDELHDQWAQLQPRSGEVAALGRRPAS